LSSGKKLEEALTVLKPNYLSLQAGVSVGTPALSMPTPLRDAAGPVTGPAVGRAQMPSCHSTPGTPEHPSASHPQHRPANTHSHQTRHGERDALPKHPNQIQGQAEGEKGRVSAFFLPLCFSPLVLEEKVFKKRSLVGQASWNEMMEMKQSRGEKRWGRHRGWKGDASQPWGSAWTSSMEEKRIKPP